jgi:hypothetical protein
MFILLLLDQAGQVGRPVEHSERKGGESDVAIPRFLCGVIPGFYVKTEYSSYA